MATDKTYSIEEARGIARFMINTCEAQNRTFTVEEEKFIKAFSLKLRPLVLKRMGGKLRVKRLIHRMRRLQSQLVVCIETRIQIEFKLTA